MLAAGGVPSASVALEGSWVLAYLGGHVLQRVRRGPLAGPERPSGIAQVAELDGKADLRSRTPALHDRDEVLLGEGVVAGHFPLVHRIGKLG
jgi:hypothetical protein